MVKIRLMQTGSKNKRSYRIVAIDESKRRNGRHIEILGFYNPNMKPPMVSVKHDRVKYWVSVGAQYTPTISKLIEQAQK